MLIQHANKYCAEPTPYQAQAMGQWVGACRWAYNAALERGIVEYENYGLRLDYHAQARELTLERAKRDWLAFAPVHALAIRPASPRRRVCSLAVRAEPFP
jgi:putative transposase